MEPQTVAAAPPFLEHLPNEALDTGRLVISGDYGARISLERRCGDADFVLVISTKSMDDYEQFSRRFFAKTQTSKGSKQWS
ncbi:hypothetical protein AWV80_09000 [Cupriavidus sp. UYMU48A]|nr:hypothetical protein AWV80_09000 [Cupriavidus sp. UYMU48A]